MRTNVLVKHHPDCHFVFDHAFYSAPHRLIGQKLWVRSADTSVQIFYQHELVASHPRAIRRGPRPTIPITCGQQLSQPHRARAFPVALREGVRSAIDSEVRGWIWNLRAKSLEISPISKPKLRGNEGDRYSRKIGFSVSLQQFVAAERVGFVPRRSCSRQQFRPVSKALESLETIET
jgi:hypothetical protein